MYDGTCIIQAHTRTDIEIIRRIGANASQEECSDALHLAVVPVMSLGTAAKRKTSVLSLVADRILSFVVIGVCVGFSYNARDSVVTPSAAVYVNSEG